MSTRIVRYKIPSVVSAAWAKGFGDITLNNTSQDLGTTVTTDALGNIYWAGYFNGTIDLGGTVNERLTATSGVTNMFLAKFDRTGAHIWSRKFTTTSISAYLQIAVSATTRNIYFAGLFTGGSSLVKLNEAGTVLWAKGPPSGASRVALGSDDSAVITGFFVAPFQSQMDFGNGITLYSAFSSRDVFLAKYDADGNCLWAKSFGNNGGTDEGYGVAVNQGDNSIFVGGWAFGNDLYLNGGGSTLGLPEDTPHYYRSTAQQNTFSFLAKFTSTGTIVWSKTMGRGVSSDPYNTFTRLQSLALDSDGNLLTGGAYNIKSNWGAGSYTGTTSTRNGWVAKYNGATGDLMWVQPIDGNQTLWVMGVAVGPQNSLVAAGYFFGVYNFGGASLSNPHSDPNHNAYIAKYSSAGVLDIPQLRQFGNNPLADAANGVAVDGDYALMTGYFQQTVDFNGTSLTTKGGVDAFLMRLPIA